MKDKVIYKETYKSPGLEIHKQALPLLNHLTKGFHVVEASIKESGVIERGESRLEYQIIKVLISDE